ncbi:PIN domain-containing protein [Candidatus Micrarchaeota archaeon]|nr:PIN domain-containing protein [Candidatus Micrarchaeota archaeon]
MDRFLADSSIILDILEGNSSGQKAVELLKTGEACTSIICFCEVLNKTNSVKREKARVFLSKLFLFALSVADGETAVEMQDSCRATGGFVPTIDCLIAATALNNGAILLSSDNDFERIQQVKKKIL